MSFLAPTLRLLRPLATRIPSVPLARPTFGSTFSRLEPRASSSFSTTAPVLALARKPTKIKLKTHKGAAKRWTAIANGQFKRGKVGRVHLNSNGNMSPTRLNRLGQTAYARTIERKLLRRLMPYA
ncbi:mitochondrial 54S ribosomal protein bL35m MRP35 [Sporobolomyces koalae]|uniref:mitochondrial 54S ribosomal protein bL35m MRP35 n=1 Tax=Sporobolomyces koalae TaxID=500713 RepID=UPI003173FA1A